MYHIVNRSNEIDLALRWSPFLFCRRMYAHPLAHVPQLESKISLTLLLVLPRYFRCGIFVRFFLHGVIQFPWGNASARTLR